MVELLGGPNEPDRPLLDQIQEREALVPVALRDRDDEAEVGLDHRLLRSVVAALDALCQLDLLRRGQEVDLADVLEEELERLGRDLPLLGHRLGLILFLGRGFDELDLQLVEAAVELVELRRVDLDLLERDADVLGCETPRLLGAGDQRLEDPFRGAYGPCSYFSLHRSPLIPFCDGQTAATCRSLPAIARQPP